uniref:Uncharacterized protein n=1 Tax=Rhizophora mucronata TaxID=61149 RepID=A0A2P2PJN9_RHIMU
MCSAVQCRSLRGFAHSGLLLELLINLGILHTQSPCTKRYQGLLRVLILLHCSDAQSSLAYFGFLLLSVCCLRCPVLVTRKKPSASS